MANSKPPREESDGPPPVNPYLDWAIATNFRHMRSGDWLPMLVEFRFDALVSDINRTPLQVFSQLGWLGATWKQSVVVPDIFAELPAFIAESHEINFCALLVKRSDTREVVADDGWARTIASVELGPPVALGKGKADPGTVQPPPEPEKGIGACLVDHVKKALGMAADKPLTGTAEVASAPASSPSLATAAVKRVLIAVLDEGIAFAHERFRDGAVPRIEYLWKQDGVFGAPLGLGMPGAELTAADITTALTDFTSNGRVDEDRLYQREGDVDFTQDGFKALARRRAHGTHVMDLAAGGDATLTPGRPPIIAVELPESSVADPAGSPLYFHIYLGLLYVLVRAQQVRHAGENLPVVVNLSYGPQHGPHDGSSLFERLVDLLVKLSLTQASNTPMKVVLAAGNSRQTRTHAGFRVAKSNNKVMYWQLQPEDLTPSFVELWLHSSDGLPANAAVTVTSPQGDAVTVTPGAPPAVFSGPKGEVFRATYELITTSASRSRVLIIAQATATDPPLDPALPTAPPGRWVISVQNNGATDLDVECWIARDGPIAGRRARGRQSYFDDPDYERYDLWTKPVGFDPLGSKSYVKRQGTLSGIATGTETCVIGGYRRRSKPWDPTNHVPENPEPASYSSEGPVAQGAARAMKAPNWLAPSDDAPSCPGVLAAGTRSGSRLAMNGSSVAAPQAARYFADQYAMTGTFGPMPPAGLFPVSSNVPAADRPLVAGDGLMDLPGTLGRP